MGWCRRSAAVVVVLAAFCRPAIAEQADPLTPLLSQAEAFIRRSESGGVTLDSRHFPNFPEHLRLTVVPQLAGFCDLYRAAPTDGRLLDITERADFLVGLGANARNGDAADGMLAYALLRAFEVTGRTTYRDAAQPILSGFLSAPVVTDANRGLMAALALAQYGRLTSDPVARTRLTEILLLTERLQHADGSFDHVCAGARDVHYTAWIGMEMDLLLRLVDDPVLRGALDRAQGFLSGRIAADAAIAYQDVLGSGATILYYSKPVCPSDYDTRGWSNELGYHALLLDRTRDARYSAMMARLSALQNQGAWPDKWDYLPNYVDPSYVWASAPRSVVRTSLMFWTLAAIQSRRANRGVAFSPQGQQAEAGGVPGAERGEASLRLAPNPARGGAWITLRLAHPSSVRLQVLDASGRRVRDLLGERLQAGARTIRWDGRDQGGSRAPAGVYFVRLEAEGRSRSARLVWIESAR